MSSCDLVSGNDVWIRAVGTLVLPLSRIGTTDIVHHIADVMVVLKGVAIDKSLGDNRTDPILAISTTCCHIC